MTSPHFLKDHPIPPLVTLGHPRLAQPSAPVPVEQVGTEAFADRLEILRMAMTTYLGIGIAAPQIGWWERFFWMATVNPEAEGGYAMQAWINPKITAISREKNWAWEGCLSVPGLRGWIRRPSAVRAVGLNEQGEQVQRNFGGWSARVFQHEYDHLDGMLFPYRVLNPRHIVTLEEMEHRADWPEDWPAAGARDTPLGSVLADTPVAAPTVAPVAAPAAAPTAAPSAVIRKWNPLPKSNRS